MKVAVTALFVSGMMAGCGSGRTLPPPPPPVKKVVQYAVTSGGENLTALTKVTDGDDVCTMPFGGDDGKDLFYLKRLHDGAYTYSNVYKKENPLQERKPFGQCIVGEDKRPKP